MFGRKESRVKTPTYVSKLSNKVNRFYVIAMLIESIATDMSLTKVLDVICPMRAFVHDTMPDKSDDFGTGAEQLEQLLSTQYRQEQLLPILLEALYMTGKAIHEEHNRYEKFTFSHFIDSKTIRYEGGEFDGKIFREVYTLLKTV